MFCELIANVSSLFLSFSLRSRNVKKAVSFVAFFVAMFWLLTNKQSRLYVHTNAQICCRTQGGHFHASNDLLVIVDVALVNLQSIRAKESQTFTNNQQCRRVMRIFLGPRLVVCAVRAAFVARTENDCKTNTDRPQNKCKMNYWLLMRCVRLRLYPKHE